MIRKKRPNQTMHVELQSALFIGVVIGLVTGVILMLAIAPWRY